MNKSSLPQQQQQQQQQQQGGGNKLEIVTKKMGDMIKATGQDGLHMDSLETGLIRQGFTKNDITQALRIIEENSEV